MSGRPPPPRHYSPLPPPTVPTGVGWLICKEGKIRLKGRSRKTSRTLTVANSMSTLNKVIPTPAIQIPVSSLCKTV
ncbi:hypothetical protein J6590_045558 [Homalodisca vitripennis]|nr:hypothetical protein J6590_045558 [Homalodisca vitripennis]